MRIQLQNVNNSPVELSPPECTTTQVVKGPLTYGLSSTLEYQPVGDQSLFPVDTS
jgi:hypothetical protein